MAEIAKRINVFNSAGATVYNPILRGLGLRFVYIPDVTPTSQPAALIKPVIVASDPLEVNVSGLLSPSTFKGYTVGVLDTDGRFSDANITSWAGDGLAAGDFLYITDVTGAFKTGLYEVADVGVPSAEYCRLLNPYREDGQMLWPFNGAKTALTWWFAYVMEYDSSDGLIQAGIATISRDAANVAVEHEVVFTSGSDTLRGRFFVRDALDSELVILDGLSWDGFTTTKQDGDRFAISFLRAPRWLGNGGVGTVEIVAGTDFYWNSDHDKQGEERIELVKHMGVYVSSGTGSKTGTFRLRSRFGDTVYRDVAVTITVTAQVDQFNKERF